MSHSMFESMRRNIPYPFRYNSDYREVELENAEYDSDEDFDTNDAVAESEGDSSESSIEIELDRYDTFRNKGLI